MKLDTLYDEVLTHLTINLYCSIGDEGAFLLWLNYHEQVLGRHNEQDQSKTI